MQKLYNFWDLLMVCGDKGTEYLKSGQYQKIEAMWFPPEGKQREGKGREDLLFRNIY